MLVGLAETKLRNQLQTRDLICILWLRSFRYMERGDWSVS